MTATQRTPSVAALLAGAPARSSRWLALDAATAGRVGAFSLLAAVVVLTYSGIWVVPFVWDDVFLLDEVRARSGQGVLGVLTQRLFDADRFGDSPHYYRPLALLSLHFDRWLWGERAAGFHLFNLSLHVANASLVLALCRRGGASLATALVAALCFALFPRLTESVSWISGRTDLLAAFGGLLAIWLHTAPGASARHRSLAAVALLVGLCGKEIAAAALLAILAVELQRVARKRRPGEFVARVAPSLLALVAYLALRLAAGSRAQGSAYALADRIVFAFQTLGTYFEMVLDPLHPAFRIGQLGELSPLAFGLGYLAAVLLLGALMLCITRRWDAMKTVGLMLLGGGLFPALHLLPTSIDVVAADRFLYVPLAGLAVLGASATAATRFARPATWAVALAVLPLFVLGVRQRNLVWADERALWEDTVRQASPLDPRPLQELAGVHHVRGELALALEAYEASFALRPERWVLERIGGTLFELGRFEEALVPFERLASVDPDRPQNHFHLGLVHHRLGQYDLAADSLRRSLALAPAFAPASQLLASLPDGWQPVEEP